MVRNRPTLEPETPPPTGSRPASTPAPWPFTRIARPRRAPLWLLATALVVVAASTAFFQLLAFPAPARWFPPLLWCHSLSGGVIGGTLVATTTMMLLTFVVLLGWIGGLRPRDVGVDGRRLLPAVALTFTIWLASQLAILAMLAASGQEITISRVWSGHNCRNTVSGLLGQMLGNCPFEEIFYRGFLLPQCMLSILERLPGWSRRGHVALALLVSQGIFALTHVFLNQRSGGWGQWMLVGQFIMGLAFAGLYLRTGNLFLAMGLHMLVNGVDLMFPLFEGRIPGQGLIGLGIGCAVVVGARLGRRQANPTEQDDR